jgi:dUTP pyrophosphatase
MKLVYELMEHGVEPYAVPLPEYKGNAACFDIAAAVKKPVAIQPGKWAIIPTALKFSIPAGYELQIRSRSGLAATYGLFVMNSPGTIDEDYQGELKIILMNLGEDVEHICRGSRIAQVSLSPVTKAELTQLNTGNLFGEETSRGEKGFGSTGK